MAIARIVLKKVPGFDPDLGPGGLGFGEDTLFSQQVKEAGFRIAGAFDVPVEHHFREDRLTLESRIDAAAKIGKADAYIAYHWEHARWPRARVRTATAAIRWAMCWIGARSRHRSGDALAEQLLEASRNLAASRQYLRERRRPRSYEKHGLVKLGAEGPIASIMNPSAPAEVGKLRANGDHSKVKPRSASV